jgi:hypothetical protein
VVIFGWEGRSQRLDSAFEFGEVVVDGGLQDRVVGVEVAVSQVVAHACDLAPRNAGLGAEHPGGQSLYGFADFQQPDPDGVEYEAVR